MTVEVLETESNKDKLINLTARLVAAYVTNNSVRAADLPTIIDDVHSALVAVNSGIEETAIAAQRPEPAVNPRKSVTPDYITCLEDGKKFKIAKAAFDEQVWPHA